MEDINKVVDRVYNTYCNQNSAIAYNSCLSVYSNRLIEALNLYVEQNAHKVASMFSSQKKELTETDYIDNIVCGLNSLACCVNCLFDKYEQEDELSIDLGHHKDYSANDLLDFNLSAIEDAYIKFGDEYFPNQMYKQIINLLTFIKKHKSLNKVFKNNAWKNLETREVLMSLKDYHKSNSELFEIANEESAIEEEKYIKRNLGFFSTIKNNCDSHFKNFDKYRPCFISREGLTQEVDKLIFCKNLLEFYRTDLFVDRSGVLDCKNQYEDGYILSCFKSLYSGKFKQNEFRQNQANVMYEPNLFYSNVSECPSKMLGARSLKTDSGLIIGIILKNATNDYYYLMHMQISSLETGKTNYEIQLNLLPQGEISKRIQLIRMDNYESKKAHNNIGGKRLETTTHVHLYNHLDLFRGRKNGNYDISHNLEDDGVDFDKALELFVSIMDLNTDLSNAIIAKVKEIKTRRIKENKQLESIV